MNSFTGMVLFVYAVVLYLKYRPKSQDSRVLCVITALMGFMALPAGSANWKVQLIEIGLQMLVGFCCFVQLRRENRIRIRRRAAMKHVHRSGSELPRRIKTCA
jgi:hypothetical protein